jgi:phosphomannomutase
MPEHPQLIAFDLDGTLAESKQRMSSGMGELLSQLLKKMPVAVMSGAGWPQFERQFFPALLPDTNLKNLYVFPDNAAQCFVYRDGSWKPQYDNAFTPAEREHILKVLDEALKETGLIDVPVRVWGERIEDRGAEVAFSPLGQEAPLAEKKDWHKEHDVLRKKLHEALNKRLPEFANAMGGLTTVDITRKGITKAYGIKRLAELTGIPVARMLYVGDALDEGGNDSVVKETGVRTQAVFGPEETAGLINTLL